MNPQSLNQLVRWGAERVGPSVLRRVGIMLAGTAAAVGIREAANAVHDKVDEFEADGQLSPRAASAMRGVTRVVSVTGEVAVTVIGGAAGGAVKEGVTVTAAVQDAVRNPGASAQTYLTNMASGLTAAEGTSTWDRASASRTVDGLTERARYLANGPDNQPTGYPRSTSGATHVSS